VDDGAGHTLVTAYAVKRPDGMWSLMIVNRDQQNAHKVRISFQDETGREASFVGSADIATFGSGQYQWHAAKTRFVPHAEYPGEWPVVAYFPGNADPDGPIAHAKQPAGKDSSFELPAASVVVIRGKIGGK
jgi:hypothetical protein